MTNYQRHGRILVIDDDDVVRLAIVELLEQAGHSVFDLPSAIGATRAVAQNAIDTIVIDVMLPDIDGDKLARLLRNTAKSADLAIVLVSGRSIAELDQLASAAGADGTVSKAELHSRLVPAVDSARRRRAIARNAAGPRG